MGKLLILSLEESEYSLYKAFCNYNGYEIAGEYEDAGRSGKSIEFKLPILGEEMKLSLDNSGRVERCEY